MYIHIYIYMYIHIYIWIPDDGTCSGLGLQVMAWLSNMEGRFQENGDNGDLAENQLDG